MGPQFQKVGDLTGIWLFLCIAMSRVIYISIHCRFDIGWIHCHCRTSRSSAPHENHKPLSAPTEESITAIGHRAHHFSGNDDVQSNRPVLWSARRHPNPQESRWFIGFGVDSKPITITSNSRCDSARFLVQSSDVTRAKTFTQ
jgi:hypothetical protein